MFIKLEYDKLLSIWYPSIWNYHPTGKNFEEILPFLLSYSRRNLQCTYVNFLLIPAHRSRGQLDLWLCYNTCIHNFSPISLLCCLGRHTWEKLSENMLFWSVLGFCMTFPHETDRSKQMAQSIRHISWIMGSLLYILSEVTLHIVFNIYDEI
jgi:hypothetical protein